MPKLRHPERAINIDSIDPVYVVNRPGADRRHPSVVYYLRFRDLVKIGTTTKIRTRMNSIPNEGLLAVEFGDTTRERDRHAQFNHLRHTGEWFRFDPDLGVHIVELRERFQVEQGMAIEDWYANLGA